MTDITKLDKDFLSFLIKLMIDLNNYYEARNQMKDLLLNSELLAQDCIYKLKK